MMDDTEIEFGEVADFRFGQDERMDIGEQSFGTKIAPYTTTYLRWLTERNSSGGISSMTAIRIITHCRCLWGNDDDESNDEEEGEEEEGFIPLSHPYDNRIAHTLYHIDDLRKLLMCNILKYGMQSTSFISPEPSI